MMLTVAHITKGTYSFWCPKEHVGRVLDEYAELEWFVQRPKPAERKRRSDRDD